MCVLVPGPSRKHPLIISTSGAHLLNVRLRYSCHFGQEPQPVLFAFMYGYTRMCSIFVALLGQLQRIFSERSCLNPK